MYQLVSPSSSTISIAQDHVTRPAWLQYFNPFIARTAFNAHLDALPGALTPERHTIKSYNGALDYFLKWSCMQMPTEDMMERFIAHLRHDLKLASTTISSRYLAPARLYLRKLAKQNVDLESFVDPYATSVEQFTQRNNAFVAIGQIREHLRAASEIKSPKPEITTNIAPLWQPKFNRLTVEEINTRLRRIDRTTLLGARDYALLQAAFSSALRLAELARITPNSFSRDGEQWLITVRGKRSNIDPVPISAKVYAFIQEWIDAYNLLLAEDDPRRIVGDTPIWQPLTRSNRHMPIGSNRYNPAEGMSHQAIRDMIFRRAGIAVHDTRRTCAAIAYDNGMNITQIQALLRHKDAAVTLLYIGTKPDYVSRILPVTFG
jgi:integrase